ncbi:MAG TPA: nuclear transport factor 2 family protein [Abditibacteriaceae bacterium]|jgi:ketosteroid isomerase-like protein
MISESEAQEFALDWVEAWNSHDLNRVLSHYTDNFEMSSPFIVGFTGGSSGTLKGKAQVGAYWQSALQRIPDLHFEILEIFTGVSSITIYYRAVLEKLATEVFFFDESGKVYKAVAHYNE